MKNKYKIIVLYDGTNYSGWQIQKNELSIQKIIQDSLSLVLKEKVVVFASGRTDAGVHATGQCCHFSTSKEVKIKKIIYSLNCLLPKDIRIKEMKKAKKNFHARFCAKSKIYHYHLNLTSIEDPFSRLYSYRPYNQIDIDLLKKAAKLFIGKKDFCSFSNKQNSGACKNNSIRTLKRLDVKKTKYGVRLEFEADGF